jgi:hypothetical protein
VYSNGWAGSEFRKLEEVFDTSEEVFDTVSNKFTLCGRNLL